MKKAISLLLCSILLICIVSCNSNVIINDNNNYQSNNKESNEKNVYILAASDSNIPIKIDDYSLYDVDKYDTNEIAETIKVIIDGKTYFGKFIERRINSRIFYPVYSYITDDGFIFDVDPKGTVVFCYWGDDIDNSVNVEYEECQSRVEQFLSKYIDITKYNMNYEELDDSFQFNYTRYINGIKTSDCACVNISKHGNLISYSSRMTDCIGDEMKLSKDECQNYLALIRTKIQESLLEQNTNYSLHSYDVIDYYVTVTADNNFVFVGVVDIDLAESIGEYEVVTGIRILAIVML